MKIAGVLCALLQTSCASPNRTALKIEYCIIGDSGLLCDDPRLEAVRRSYSLSFTDAKNRVATRAKDWAAVMERLLTCEALIQE